MFSVSVEMFPAKMSYTAFLSVISWSDFTHMSRSFKSVQVFCKFVEEMIGDGND